MDVLFFPVYGCPVFPLFFRFCSLRINSYWKSYRDSWAPLTSLGSTAYFGSTATERICSGIGHNIGVGAKENRKRKTEGKPKENTRKTGHPYISRLRKWVSYFCRLRKWVSYFCSFLSKKMGVLFLSVLFLSAMRFRNEVEISWGRSTAGHKVSYPQQGTLGTTVV